jgi:predicted lipid-binding transport protein (Tim44 family)
MKSIFAVAATLLAFYLFALPVAEAKRLGGGSSLGKQYSMPRSTPTQQAKPAGPATSQAAAAAAPRASGASRWLGPLAGLAAGGLLASLFFGDAFEGLQVMDFLLIAGLVIGGFMLFRLMRRGASPAPATAGAGLGTGPGGFPSGARPVGSRPPSSIASDPYPLSQTGADRTPSWFNGPAFIEGARNHFIRMQAAWDRADFRDIREYTTPQLYADLQRERERLGSGPQYTEVVTLDVQLASMRRDGDLAVASLEFSGLIREEETGTANPFREIWHVQHDWTSPEGDWFIAGIQQAE